MKRVSFFIDGFNLYHSLIDFTPEYRWLDLNKLCSSFLKEDEQVENIYYFTALSWKVDKIERHKTYMKALRTTGVKPILGEFKQVERHCSHCNQKYIAHEEKRTDVNIAMWLFEDGMKDLYDKAVIISGDSDLIPPIEKIQQNFPNKKIGVIIPLGRRAKQIQQTADFSSKIDRKKLRESLLPDKIELSDGCYLYPPKGWIPN